MKIEIQANRVFGGKIDKINRFRAVLDGDTLATAPTKTEAMDKAMATLYGYYQQRCATLYCATAANGCVMIGREYFPGNEDISHFYPNADGTMRSGGTCSGLIGKRSMRDSFEQHVASYRIAIAPVAEVA